MLIVIPALGLLSQLGLLAVIVGAAVYGDNRSAPFGFGMFIAAHVAAFALLRDWVVTSVVALVVLGVFVDRVAALVPWRLRLVRPPGSWYRLDLERLSTL